MSQWPSVKAKRVLAALLAIGWEIKRRTGHTGVINDKNDKITNLKFKGKTHEKSPLQ
jgi:predicted RNA binding protein YcfA (HicA-like mRNA interferase family)